MRPTDLNERIYRQTTRGIAYNFGGKNLGFILNFMFTILIARELGPSEFGGYSFYRTMAEFLALFTILGLDQTLVHFIPALIHTRDSRMLPGLIRRSRRTVLTGTGIMITLSVIAFSVVPRMVDPGRAFPGDIMILFIGVLVAVTLSGLYRGIMAGLFRQREWNMTETAFITGKLVFTFVVLRLGYGLQGVLLAVILVNALPPVLYHRWSKRDITGSTRTPEPGGHHHTGKRAGPDPGSGPARVSSPSMLPDPVVPPGGDPEDHAWTRMRRYALTMMVFTASYIMLDNQIDIIMLRFLSGSSEAGYYNIAFRFAFISSMIIVGAIDGVLVPAFTSLGRSRAPQMRSTLGAALRYTLFFLVPLSVAGFLFSRHLIVVFFGEEYLRSADMLRIFYGTLVLSIALAWPMRFLMISVGKERRILTLYVAYGLFNVAGNLILIPLYEGFGAVAATGLVSWVITFHLFLEVKRTGLMAFPGRFTLKTVMASLAAAAPFLVLSVTIAPGMDGVFTLFGVYLIFCGIYLGVILALGGVSITEIRTLRDMMTAGTPPVGPAG